MFGPDFIDRLAARLQSGPLPGAAAQYRMAHGLRQNYGEAPPSARRAAVLALLHPVNGRLHLLFIQRTSPPGDRHAGQISFPGGSAEDVDANLSATAGRETEEEVGVPRGDVRMLGALSELYIPVSNFLVAPFVGYIDPLPVLRLQASEVARTIQLPLDAFPLAESRVLLDKELANGLTLTKVPHYAIGEERIWGATAMMVSELVEVINLSQ